MRKPNNTQNNTFNDTRNHTIKIYVVLEEKLLLLKREVSAIFGTAFHWPIFQIWECRMMFLLANNRQDGHQEVEIYALIL
jgi:hypothetical protein